MGKKSRQLMTGLTDNQRTEESIKQRERKKEANRQIDVAIAKALLEKAIMLRKKQVEEVVPDA